MSLDPRGTRFAAWLTTVMLVIVLATAVVSAPAAGVLALGQAIVFAVGAANARHSPYGLIFRVLLAPRLGPPSYLEPAAWLRFAQGVGLAFAAIAAVGYLAGAPIVGSLAALTALAAAFLNAAFGLCLACKVYPFVRHYLIRKPQGAHS